MDEGPPGPCADYHAKKREWRKCYPTYFGDDCDNFSQPTGECEVQMRRYAEKMGKYNRCCLEKKTWIFGTVACGPPPEIPR